MREKANGEPHFNRHKPTEPGLKEQQVVPHIAPVRDDTVDGKTGRGIKQLLAKLLRIKNDRIQ